MLFHILSCCFIFQIPYYFVLIRFISSVTYYFLQFRTFHIAYNFVLFRIKLHFLLFRIIS